MTKILLVTGLLVAYGYIQEHFIAWYSGNPYEEYAFANRRSGPYAPLFWVQLFCNVLVPQVFWFSRARTNLAVIWLAAVLVNVGMWLERFLIIVVSLSRDFLPSSWHHYTPTLVDWGIFGGSLFFFGTLFLVFLGRACVYFLCWGVVSHLLARWSTRQDDSGELAFTVKQRRLGAGSLPAMALTLSFAAEDWLMSLEPTWSSTVYSIYYFSGAFLAALAVLALAAAYARGPNLFGALLSPAHFGSLGKLLLAFTAFWAYIAFCQVMLIWIANIPEEAPWYLARGGGGWRPFAVFLGLGQFLLPFFALLSRRVTRSPKALAVVAWWILLAHAVDTYWLVMPALHPDAPHFWWPTLTAFVGVGGLFLGFAIWRLRGHYAVPVMDPYLPHSLRYDP